MIETVAQIFGMIFVFIIIICLIGTISNYISNAYFPNNKIEENLKKFDKKFKTK